MKTPRMGPVHREEELAPHEPDARALQQLPEEGPVVVQRLGAVRKERLEVPGHVAEDEARQDDPRDRHDDLLADRGIQEGSGRSHSNCSPYLINATSETRIPSLPPNKR